MVFLHCRVLRAAVSPDEASRQVASDQSTLDSNSFHSSLQIFQILHMSLALKRYLAGR